MSRLGQTGRLEVWSLALPQLGHNISGEELQWAADLLLNTEHESTILTWPSAERS